MQDKSEYFNEQAIISITFSYGIRDGRALEKVINTDVSYQNYYHHKLPITMNPLEYGRIIRKINNIYFMQINDSNLAIITQLDEYNEIEFYRSEVLVYKYRDTHVDVNSFIRDFGNKKFHFTNNELTLITVKKPVKFISNLKKGWKSE